MSKNKNKSEEFVDQEAEMISDEEQEIVSSEDAVSSEENDTDACQATKDNLDALRIENQHLKEEYLRALAEAENIKKRCAQEIDKNNKYAISSFAKSLLSVADNLHRAIAAAENSKDSCQELLKGVEMTEAELMKVFEKNGITRMEALGTVFNPNFHQVIQEVEDAEKPNGTIISELQTGYMLNDRILREAMVVVTKGGK